MRPIFIALGVSATLIFATQPADAGILKWLKKGTGFLVGKAEKSKNARTYRRDVNSKILTRSNLMEQASRATTAFQVGAYTFSGVMIFNAITSYGYASSGNSEHEDKKVQDEIATAAASGIETYHENYCVDAGNSQRFVVPSTTQYCPDGTQPIAGNGIPLENIRVRTSK